MDYVCALASWSVFYIVRTTVLEDKAFVPNQPFYLGITLVPLGFLLLYTLQGTYLNVRRMYRLKTLQLTLFSAVVGSLLLFFLLILDDDVQSYRSYHSKSQNQ